MQSLGSETLKIGSVEYLAIELNDSVRAALQALTAAGFAPSYKAAIAKSLNHSLARLKHRLPDVQTTNSDASVLDVKLSRRQKELLPLLNAGLSNREIATHLNVSEHTVKVHLWRFFKKIKINNRTQLLYLARLNGWI